MSGLLMIKEGSKVYFPAFSTAPADGSLDAKFEYGAFGEPLRVGGTAIADDNPFRFSTKYLDTESGLIYYGFRYYSPFFGRFLNRGPIGEEGGQNLYAFVENDPVNGWDYLGMEIIEGECHNEGDPGCKEDDIGQRPTIEIVGRTSNGDYIVTGTTEAIQQVNEMAQNFQGADGSNGLTWDAQFNDGSQLGWDGDSFDGPNSQTIANTAQGGAEVLSGLADIGQGLIGVAGLAPALGNAADALNIAISAARGNYDDATLDSLTAIPAVGQVPGVVNVSRKVSRGAEGIWNSIKKLVRKDPPAKPSLSAHKRALSEVHMEVGKLPKGHPGKFGSPQAGTPTKDYRLDPPHPNAKPGSPESQHHIDWWDYSGGKRGKGGRSGAVPIED